MIFSNFDSFVKKKNFGALLSILAIAAFPIFLLYPYSLDDLQAFSAIQSRSYLDLALGSHGWSGTAFYRPLIDLQTKVIWDAFEGSFFAFKLYQFFLFVVFLLTLNNLVEKLSLNLLGATLLVAMVMSSRAIHDAFFWWVNMGQAIVLICFTLMLNFLFARQTCSSSDISESSLVRSIIYGCLSFLALFSKETGLVVLMGFAYLAYLERNRLALVQLFVVLFAFVLARIYVVGGIEGQDAFMASSGLGFSFLSSEELRDAFGKNEHIYYLYNITSQFMYVIFRQPVNGQFINYYLDLRALAVGIYALSSAYLLMLVLCRKICVKGEILSVLLSAIAINSLLSFPYSRERIMIAADLAGAVLFALIASSLHGSSSDASKRLPPLRSLDLGVIAALIVLTISLTKALRRYFVDISISQEAMLQFVNKDYHFVIEAQGPLPPTVIESVIDSVSAHYSLILRYIELLI